MREWLSTRHLCRARLCVPTGVLHQDCLNRIGRSLVPGLGEAMGLPKRAQVVGVLPALLLLLVCAGDCSSIVIPPELRVHAFYYLWWVSRAAADESQREVLPLNPATAAAPSTTLLLLLPLLPPKGTAHPPSTAPGGTGTMRCCRTGQTPSIGSTPR